MDMAGKLFTFTFTFTSSIQKYRLYMFMFYHWHCPFNKLRHQALFSKAPLSVEID